MGSIVYFHPKQKYVFKFSNKETRLKEEYLRYKEIYDKNLPIPKLIGFLNIESGVSNIPNKALVTEYGGEPIYYKLNSNRKCKKIWLDNLKETIRLYAKNGYIQTDLSNLGNFIIDENDNVLMIDVDSIKKKNNLNINSTVNYTYKTLLKLINKTCNEFIS